MNRFFTIFCMAALAFALTALPLQAQNYGTTWTGATDRDFVLDSNWSAGISTPGAIPLINTTGSTSPILSTGSVDAVQTWVGSIYADGAPSNGYLLQTGGSFSNSLGMVVGGSGVTGESVYRIEGGTVSTPYLFWIGGDDQDSGAGTNFGHGKLEMTGGTLTKNGAWNLEVGFNGGTGVVEMSGTSTIDCANSFLVGRGMGSDAITQSNGTMTIGSTTGTASLTVGTHLYVGHDGGHGGLEINNGASINVHQYLVVGHAETLNGSNGTVTMNGGSVTKDALADSFTMLGYGGTGTWVQNGGTYTDGTAVILGQDGGYTGTIELNGGVFSTGAIQVGYTPQPSAGGRIFFNGGTLKANPDSIYLATMTTSPTYGFLTAFGSHDAHAYVKSGGAVIDTSGVDIMIAMPLEEDTSSTGGGLTKIGDGALVLTGASTYTGVTTIEQGTLRYLEAASASSSFVVKENTKLTGYTLGTSMPPIENFVPATIVENNGTIAPGTVGRTMYMNALNLADGAKLDFKTAAGGQCDGLWILGDVLPSGTTTPAVITVSYTGTVNVPTTLIACQGTLSSDVHFQLPSGLPKLDSEDGINTPILLETNSGVYGSVILKPGGPIADPVWNVFAGGTYSTPDKWSTNSVPNGGGQRAMFTGMLGFGTINVSLNTSPQLSSMVFDSPFGESYSIAPTGTNAITLHSTMAQNWHISLLAGTHAVAANLKLQAGSGESTIRLADNSKLTLSGVLSDETTAANVNVVGNFNGGTLANSVLALSGANTYTGKTTVTNAVLEIASLGVVANANPLGKSSVDPANFVLDNSTLHYTGTAAVSTDRGMTLAGANVKFQMDGNASVSGNIVTGTTVPNVEKTGVGALTLNDTVARTNTLGGLVLVSQGNLNFAGGTDTVYSMDILSLGVEGGSAVTVNQTSGTVSLPSASSSYVMVGMDAPATYNMTGGKLTLAANRMVYLGYADATTTGGTGIMNVSGASEITAEGFIVGWSGTDNAGVLNQSGGTISLSGGARTTNAWSQTIGNNAYGCANISGGTLQYSAQTGGNAYIGAHNTGIMNITGGTFETVNSTNFYVGGDGTENPGYGLINVSGGSFKMRQEDAGANDGWALILGIPGTAVLNVSGTGLVDLQGSETTVKSYLFVGARDAATGIINLGAVGTGGGTIKNAAYVKRITGSGTVNFHGGTLVASEAADPFGIGIADSYMDNLTNAYIYPEGAKVSVEADHAAIIAQVLEDPTGNGLTNASITLADGGSGYVATPLVTISGGGGTGATANAVIDAGGYVTGIVITNPGVGYLTAPDIVISGGGGTGALAAGNDSHFVANVGGAFTKLGEGTLTLTGANTYTGDTIVEAGTLNIANLSTPNATVYVGEDGTLNCSSIVADTLNIGALPTAGAMVAVPEPGSLALLALAGLAIAGAYLRRR